MASDEQVNEDENLLEDRQGTSLIIANLEAPARHSFSVRLDRHCERLEDDLLFERYLDDLGFEEGEREDASYSAVTNGTLERRAKMRAGEISLSELNGTFRAVRSGKRNSGVNRCDKVNSRAKNAFHRNPAMRRAYALI